MPDPRMFTMIKKVDATGVSGTGRNLDGIVFCNGQVVIAGKPFPCATGPYRGKVLVPSFLNAP